LKKESAWKDPISKAEIITHAAFYAGWPNAWATFALAKEVYSEDCTGL
jgi:alkylhydroperoxidase/carboxymuconolactone decarboxylase family protein YurZ